METYIKFEEEKLKKIEKITLTNYEAKGDFLPLESVLYIIDDLLAEVDTLQEKITDIKQNLKDNYKPVSIAEQVGVSDSDFV